MISLEDWLNETDRLRDQGNYFNQWLGTPKYENGLDRLYPDFTPLAALQWWRAYEQGQGFP